MGPDDLRAGTHPMDYANSTGAAGRLASQSVRRLGLSATPAPNLLSDLWGVLDVLEPGCWGTSLEFLKRYCDAKPGEFGGWDATGRSNVVELQARLRTMTHKVEREVVTRSLPPLRRQVLYLAKEDQCAARGFRRQAKAAAKLGERGVFELKLHEAAARKRKWLLEYVEEAVKAGQKVVVFTGRRKDCEELADTLTKRLRKINAPLWWGHGGLSSAARDTLVQEYASYQGACAFVGTTNAFGEAYDGFQCSDQLIQALLPWTPGMVEQSEGRVHRKGSDRNVLIVYPICERSRRAHLACCWARWRTSRPWSTPRRQPSQTPIRAR